MSHRCLILTIAAMLLASAPAATQQAETLSASGVSRTPWGDPDLRGTWTGIRGVPVERPLEVLTAEQEAQQERFQELRRGDLTLNVVFPEPETEVTRRATPPPVLVVDPPNGRIPLTKEAQVASDSWKAASHGVGAKSWEDFDLWDRCITRGGPPMSMVPSGYNHGVMILQTPDHVVLLHEIIHDVRIIPLGGQDHPDPRIGQYWGDSRGHWEGDVLVVEVTNFSDKTFGTQQPAGSYRGGGRGQRIVERFTPIDNGTLEYRATVEDPRTVTRPWTMVVPLLRDDNYVLYEYACHEGNYGFDQMMRALQANTDGR